MARQKKILEKSIDVKVEDVVNDAEEIVEQTEEDVDEEEVVNDEEDVNEEVIEDVKEEEVIEDVEEDEVMTERQLLCKWELQRLITVYGIDDFIKVVKMMLK